METRVETRLICPEELRQPMPPGIGAPPPDGTIEAPRAVIDWFAAHILREGELERRLADAACAQ